MQLEVLTFSDRSTATEVLADIQDEDFDWGTDIAEHSVALSRNKHGRVKIHQAHEAATFGALTGGAMGLLVGSLVLSPLFGTAFGAATGAAIGSAADPDPVDDFGLDRQFLKDLGGDLEKNSSAVIIAVPDARAAAAAEKLASFAAGRLYQSELDDEALGRLQAQLDETK
jgi:uncharacterized membrane protein